jgi:uncharacterized protein with von Willebrand factor type A (vWA) domain
MLEESKRKILATYESEAARRDADRAYRDRAAATPAPPAARPLFQRAVAAEQIADLERLWYRVDQRTDFARALVRLIDDLGRKYEVEKLAAKYAFTGKKPMSVDKALEIKEELETIDRLIDQLREAAKNAKLYVINLDELARFADDQQMQSLESMRRQVEELLRHLAEQQGLQSDGGQYRLTPKAMKLFQSKLLDRIFCDLHAARSGRHQLPVVGDGVVEMQRTKPYEFGDSLANMDVTASMTNAMIREARDKSGMRNAECGTEDVDPVIPKSESRIRHARRIRLLPEDIEIHETRNTPKCASVVCMDMSGSMRWGGAYVDVKRMALALHGLIRTEYPGDFLDFVEIYSVARRRHFSEIATLLPKPVTIHDPVVRLKADLSDERLTESDLPPHFTNLQHGLDLARRLLTVQDTPNRQIILITDGLPTAHFEANWLYLLYPPHARTERETLREGLRCRQAGITVNVFLLSSWSQTAEDVRFAHRLAESTAGRVLFVGGRELDRFVVWDYLKKRRQIIG